MLDYRHIAIIGCGLIGGSFALALRRAGFAGRITATGGARGPRLAVERGIVDAIEESFERGDPCDADLIYLAAPIGAIIDFLRTRGAQLRPGTLVTDAGSTKVEICRVARAEITPPVSFIGGHPMAGSDQTGVEYARADLFDRATYALAVTPETDPASLEAMRLIATALGARPFEVDPEEHDRAVALISHLPQLLSSALASLLESDGKVAPRALAAQLAASGWRDTTRLANSSWSVWRDIIMTNQPPISTALDALIDQLQGLKEALDARDFNRARELFEAAHRALEAQRARRLQPFERLGQ